SWVPGGYHSQTKSYPYDDAIARTELAMQDGILKGILWHQGESDCKEPNASDYYDNLTELIERFREEFNSRELPFIIGQLGQFPEKPWHKTKQKVNDAQIEVSETVDFVGFVSSDGLTSKPDLTHFNAASQREFGRRYAEEYLEVIQELPVERE
ncbi:MAG: sialate O-acetylesterase, partial [Puniceicoccales bacterium]